MKRIKLSQDLTMEALADHNYSKIEENNEETQQQTQTQMERRLNDAPEMNPLEIDLILDTLFAFCSADTLANCRLVSRQWKDVSLKAWRKKALLCPDKVARLRYNGFEGYLKLLESEEDNTLQLKTFPFRNFLIRDMLWNKSLGDDAKLVSDIARHVKLQNYLTRDYSRNTKLQLKTFLSKFHSLEVLELENVEWVWDDGKAPTSKVRRLKILENDGIGHCSNFKDFLRCFQNLEALSIEDRSLETFTYFVGWILHSAKTIRTEGEIAMNLKELEVILCPKILQRSYPFLLCPYMNGKVEHEIITPIVECRFPLERLTVHVAWDEYALKVPIHPIYRVLESCKETLCYLKTSFVFDPRLSRKILKLYLQKKKTTLQMEALKEVHLSNGLWGMNILAGLDLPRLEKLVVDTSESDCCEILDKEFHLPRLAFPKGRVYGSLKNLEFLDIRGIPGLKTIKAFTKIMPNLTHLTIPLDKHTFEIVCQNFHGLITFNVLAAQCRYEQLDDESFTGISNENGVRRPNITDLALLTHLSVECERENSSFTDHSVVYGLLQVAHLRSLSICFKELSDGNKLKLMNHVKGYVNIQVKTPSRSRSMPESY